MTAWLGEPALNAFPWATLAANAIGSLLMGVLAGSLARGFIDSYADPVRLVVGVGLLGGFTTFSAFSLETWLLVERGELSVAAFYAILSVLLSVGALVLGLTITRVF